MSWIFGILRTSPVPKRPCIPVPDAEASIHSIVLPSLQLAAGGIPETCLCETSADQTHGWIVVGLGIEVSGRGVRLLTRADWKTLLEVTSFDAGTLDGHFVILRWSTDRIECFTDSLGLRTAYAAPLEDGVCISTRLDWVARLSGRKELDAEALGGKWFYLNQQSYASGVVGIERLAPGGHAVWIRGRRAIHRAVPFLPEFGRGMLTAAREILEGLVGTATHQDRTVSLGLSGGMDSRVLLAALHGAGPFALHSFGDTLDPDVRTAQTLARALEIPHDHFHEGLPDRDACLALVCRHAAAAHLTESVSAAVKLRYFPDLRRMNRLTIDGGFGEIARRHYFSRLVHFGRSALYKGHAAGVLRWLRLSRADIFSPETAARMHGGCLAALETAMSAMPRPGDVGIENYVDLFALRTRIPNYGGPEQARMDAYIVSFMPLVQPSFLRAVFQAGPADRANGRFYRRLIRDRCPTLARVPLVKSGITYPFSLPDSAAWLFTKIKARTGIRYVDPTSEALLTRLKDVIIDLAHSEEVRTQPYADARRVVELVDRYYGGDRSCAMAAEWWLTFELWRRAIVGRSV